MIHVVIHKNLGEGNGEPSRSPFTNDRLKLEKQQA